MLQQSKLVYSNSIDSAPQKKFDEPFVIPFYSISNGYMVISPRNVGFKKGHKVTEKSQRNLQVKSLQGTIGKATKKQLEQKINTWLKSIEVKRKENKNNHVKNLYYPVFITLTLSSLQKNNDNFIKRNLLGQFIKKMVRLGKMKYYFWRAESQKNGNIHFHIISDKFVQHHEVKKIWNNILEKNGYIDEFEKKFGHRDPNSTDIKSASDVKNFVSYVLKYAIKDEKNRPITGRLWGMSDELRDLHAFTDVLDYTVAKEVNVLINNDLADVFQGDYFTIIYFRKGFEETGLGKILNEKLNDYYLQAYEFLYNYIPVEKDLVEPPEIIQQIIYHQKELIFSKEFI